MGIRPFGGRYANISYNEYFNENKEKLLNERVWYKVVNVYNGTDEGSAFVPVLTKEKRDYLENLDDNEFLYSLKVQLAPYI